MFSFGPLANGQFGGNGASGLLFDLRPEATLVPIYFAGASGTGTFTRATVATVMGYAAAANAGATQVLLSVASGETRFQGARRISQGVWSTALADGTNISAAQLNGYLSELPGAQLVTPTASIRDMTDASWIKVTMTAALTATGVDGAANSATTLTATAGTATILQTLIAAASSRTFSAYVRRRTGTGTVLIRSGAATVDITALINSSTYTLVSITDSALNAAYGFQINTNGDAIDVDCNQFEAGAVASSRILTAAGTRNADVLSYPTSGNIPASGSFVVCGTLTPNTSDAGAALKMQFSSFTDASNDLAVYYASGTLTFLRTVAGVPITATIAFSPTSGVTGKWSARFSTISGMDIWLNGVKGTNNASTTQPVIAATMQVEGYNSVQQPYAATSRKQIYGGNLSDSQCAALST